MPKRFVVSTIVFSTIALLLLLPLTRAQDAEVARQPGAKYDFDAKGQKSAPAPRGV